MRRSSLNLPRFVKNSILACSLVGTVLAGDVSAAREAVNPLTREYAITIDRTALDPPTWWHVPGITPLIWTNDPITYESYKTTDVL